MFVWLVCCLLSSCLVRLCCLISSCLGCLVGGLCCLLTCDGLCFDLVWGCLLVGLFGLLMVWVFVINV